MASRQPSWVNLSSDERIHWVGHPSLKPIIPALVLATVIAGIGIVGTYFVRFTDFFELPALAEWSPLVLVVVGIVLALRPLIGHYSTQYAITSGDVYKKTGILSRSIEQIPHRRIQNTACSQSILERLLSYGDLTIYTAGSDTHDIIFENIPSPMKLNGVLAEEISEVEKENTAT